MLHVYVCISVGEEDEVSIKDVARMITEAMDFKGELVVCIEPYVVTRKPCTLY